jgi:hypothetical protein
MIYVLCVLFPSYRQSLNPVHVPLDLYVGDTEHANEVKYNVYFIEGQRGPLFYRSE